MLHYRIKKCIELIDELLLSNIMNRSDKEKLVKLKEEIFSINDEIIKLKVEVWEVKECLERIIEILELDFVQYLKKVPREPQTVLVRH